MVGNRAARLVSFMDTRFLDAILEALSVHVHEIRSPLFGIVETIPPVVPFRILACRG